MRRWGLLVLLVLLPALAFASPTAEKPSGAEKVLRVAIDDFAGEYLNPIEGSATSRHILRHMYDNVFDVLKSWEIAPDGLSWILRMRDDVIFHDGTKATAKDLKFSFEQVVAPSSALGGEFKKMLGDQVKAELVDDSTLRLYTKGPQPFLRAMCWSESVYLVPKDYIEKNGIESFRQHPIGTGPFMFVQKVAGDYMEFKAVPAKHWKVNPGFDRLFVYLVPEEGTRIAMLQTGKVDQIGLGMESALELEKKGLTIAQGNLVEGSLYFMHPSHPLAQSSPLHDIRVRQALSLAVNRKEIIDTVFQGRGEWELLTPPENAWYSDAIVAMGPDRVKYWQDWAKQNWRYDPEEARRLIKEAGYGDGFDLEWWSAPDQSASWAQDIAPIVAGYWEKVGARVKIINVDTATWKSRRHSTKSKDLIGKVGGADCFIVGEYAIGPIPGLNRWTTKDGSWDLLVGSPQQAAYDKLWADGMSSMDAARTGQIMDQILGIMLPSWTVVPIIAAPEFLAFGPRIKSPPYAKLPYKQPCDLYAYWQYSGVEK